MSDTSTDLGPEDIDGDEPNAVRELREANKRANEKASESTAAAEAAQKELAFIRAGVDPSTSKVADLFYKTYEGELDTDAIQAGAAELGLTEAPAPADPTLESDLAAVVATGESTAGDPNIADPTPPSGDPAEEGMKAFSEAVQAGVPSEIASTEYFNSVVGAAAQGDSRAIWTPSQHQAEVEELRNKGYEV